MRTWTELSFLYTVYRLWENINKFFYYLVNTRILNNKIDIVQAVRYKYMIMIFDFIKYNDLEFDLNEADLWSFSSMHEYLGK